MTIEENHYHVDCVKCLVCKKTFDNVLDILAIDSDFWHVDCFKEAESESESESICSTSSALLGIYNQSLGFSANAGSTQASSNSGSKKSRKISTVSFTPSSRPKPLPGEEQFTSPEEAPMELSPVETTVTSLPDALESSQISEPLLRPQSKNSSHQSKCCVIS